MAECSPLQGCDLVREERGVVQGQSDRRARSADLVTVSESPEAL
jgi:hypothetical protein